MVLEEMVEEFETQQVHHLFAPTMGVEIYEASEDRIPSLFQELFQTESDYEMNHRPNIQPFPAFLAVGKQSWHRVNSFHLQKRCSTFAHHFCCESIYT